MQYALLTAGSGRLLITRPDTNAYGNAALNMATSFHIARHLDAALYVAPLNPRQHTALTTLECAGVRRVHASPLRTALLRASCRIAAQAGRAGLRAATSVGTLDAFGRQGSGTAEEQAYFGLDLRWAYAHRPLEIRLSAAAAEDVRRRALELGLDDRARIVTLHVREGGFKAALGYVDREKDSARNARIETYRAAVDLLVSRGYTVVRFGDPSMTPFDHPGVIDLATSALRTPALEIWCVLHSRFLIASDCGPFNLSVLSGVPCLGVNMTHMIGAYPLRAHDRYILKHVIDARTEREVMLGGMLNSEHMKFRWALNRFRFEDNTATEIREAVEEMTDVLESPGSNCAPAQHAFRQAVVDFLETDYGRKKQKIGVQQPGFYLGDGWIGEAYARAHGCAPLFVSTGSS